MAASTRSSLSRLRARGTSAGPRCWPTSTARCGPTAIPLGLAGCLVGAGLISSVAIATPLGRLGDPLVLVLVLPPLATALESFGWSQFLAVRLRRIGRPIARVLAAYGLWLAMSALLTLDVAAVAAASVGLAIAGRREDERDVQLGSAILGSNVGSLLFPFSNLTNLVLLSGAGIGFATYVEAAALPQLAAAVAVGWLLAVRGMRRLEPDRAPARPPDVPADAPASFGADPGSETPPRAVGLLAGGVCLAGSAGAVVAGSLGLDLAPVFAVTAAVVACLAVADGHIRPVDLARSIPVSGVAVIVAAAVLAAPIALIANDLPAARSALSAPGLLCVVLVGGVLAAAANNLVAAAFGGVWLAGAHPITVVAYLVGTNVLAVSTPHGSLATILCRTVARRLGHDVSYGRYMRTGWAFAGLGSVAAFAALLIAR